MPAPVRFDDALPGFAAQVSSLLGDDALERNLFLRDASGRLTFVLREDIADAKRQALEELAKQAAEELAPYVESDGLAVASPDELFDPSLSEPGAGALITVRHPDFRGDVRVVERRLVGQDWLTKPQPPIEGVPPIIVFASAKGGVGRSTAICVAAADLAKHGRNVLIIDLDLEAPGLGAMLVPKDRLPRFGALDFYVENGLQELDDSFIESMIAISPLTAGQGLVHVVPATGLTSDANPENVLAKIVRAYLEDPDDTESPKTFLEQTRDLVKRLTNRNRYDAVLVDARAGLNETTAATILGLGGDTLLFGVDTPQTFKAYRYLLAHLSRFSTDVDPDRDWRRRLRLVHAKAAANPESWPAFRDRGFDLFSELLYESTEAEDTSAFSFDVDDETAPHYALRILDDSNYSQFDPIAAPGLLSEPVFERTFYDFLQGVRLLLEVPE